MNLLTPTWPRTISRVDAPEHRAILQAIYRLAGEGPMVDLGCGEAHVTRDFPDAVLVDIIPRAPETVKVLQMDIRQFPRSLICGHFNLMHMGDVIEHLSPTDAVTLLEAMDRHAGAMSIFTPVGPWHVTPDSEDPHAHKSSWCPEQFHNDGWTVWEFPSCHRFDNDEMLGAFWAWKFKTGMLRRETPTAVEVAREAGMTRLLERGCNTYDS